ncbi:MAG TPA: amino acid adenylation domain-containing protein [Herpetosiphonaceae bacterium]
MSDMFNRIADLSPQKRELLAKLLKSRGVDPSRLPIVPRTGDRSTAMLSFAQQRLWFLNQLEPGNPFYNVPTVVRFRGPLDSRAFERALNTVVERHEALRTVFPIVEGQPVQRILPALSVPLAIIDMPVTATVRDLARAEIQRPFDLAQGPLLRALLLRIQNEEHVLVLTMHHIVADGWSMKIFIQELATLYQAFSAGHSPALADLPIQYADYAVWQREWMQGEVLAAQLAYWKDQLANLPTLDVLTDHPRPPVQTFRGGRLMFALPKAPSAELTALAQAQGVTMFMLLLASWQVLLARYSRQTDIVVGSPVAGRHRLEIEGLIGCFINTLVLRADLSGNPSFRELLARVRRMCLQAYAHQDLPFEKLVEELQPTRDLSRQPLFQSMFILQDDPMGSSELTNLTLQPLIVEHGTSQFDLTLSIVDSTDGLVGTLEYNSDLFEPTTIERMAGHLQTLLLGIIAAPEQRLSELPLLTAQERQQLVDWNTTYVEYPTHLCLHTLVEQQAQRTPTAIAVVFENTSISYSDLDRRANQLARHLGALGVGGCPQGETRVGVCLHRSLDLVVALLGILKAGAAYVPLDPSYPAERLAFMLDDSQVPVLLTSQEFASRFSAAERHLPALVDLDLDWPTIAQQPTTPPTVNVSPDHPAYVIYTSGSTGQPKGAVNTHRAIVNRLLWMQDAYELDATDRVLQKTPFSFDVSVWEFFWPLLSGARLVVARPEGHKDPAYLTQVIAAQQITTLHFVPSMLRLFLEQPELEACRSLRRVICSGEALPSEVQDHFFTRLHAELHNLYGPTEAAVDVTAWACQPDHPLPIVPIGRPIANTQIYLLDPHVQPVPVGVPGELHIGGVQLARGYLHRPDLTAERFIPDPFSQTGYPQGGARLYKTGDLARYRPDGAIEFLGRLDHQIKMRGFRVEPGEIEAALRSHPAVGAAAVVLRGSASDPRLVAYIEPRAKNQELETPNAELRAYLAEHLPDYMVPSAFVLLEALPLTPNGKLDLRALPDPDGARPAPETSYVAPQSDIEQQIAEIWQAVLKIDRVGVHDNFFDLGGHSLLLIQIHRRLCETVSPNLSVVELFQYPTISALSRHITGDRPGPPAPQQAQERAATRLETMRQQRQFRQRSQSTKKSSR